MLGVHPRRARRRASGLRLKLAQRERALAMGIDLIEWTYDPLQALNAHLNFAKLGVVVEEYEENIYGESSSPLHSGSPTDRFVAEWRLDAPHVARRIDGGGLGIVRDASVASAPLVNPSRAGRALAGARAARSVARRAAAAGRDPGRRRRAAARGSARCALEWRLADARDLPALPGAPLPVVDFFLSRESGRGHYLLSASHGRRYSERRMRVVHRAALAMCVVSRARPPAPSGRARSSPRTPSAADRIWFSPNPGTMDMLRMFEHPDEWAHARAADGRLQRHAAAHVRDRASPIVGPNAYDALVRVDAFRKLVQLGQEALDRRRGGQGVLLHR